MICALQGCARTLQKNNKSGYCRAHYDFAPKRVRDQSDRAMRRREKFGVEGRVGRHGLTVQQYDTMLIAQHNACAVCLRGFADTVPTIDHDHCCCPGTWSCGKCVRALLCAKCNSGLGYFGDDPAVLALAMQYLQRHPHWPRENRCGS